MAEPSLQSHRNVRRGDSTKRSHLLQPSWWGDYNDNGSDDAAPIIILENIDAYHFGKHARHAIMTRIIL